MHNSPEPNPYSATPHDTQLHSCGSSAIQYTLPHPRPQLNANDALHVYAVTTIFPPASVYAIAMFPGLLAIPSVQVLVGSKVSPSVPGSHPAWTIVKGTSSPASTPCIGKVISTGVLNCKGSPGIPNSTPHITCFIPSNCKISASVIGAMTISVGWNESPSSLRMMVS